MSVAYPPAKIGVVNSDLLILDIGKLLETRLLIEGNSGAGKSHLGRKILEGSANLIQHIVFDKDGEWVTLCDKYDYIIAGPGGDVSADVRTAPILAERSRELGFSLIIDLSDMTLDEQRDYVAQFSKALLHVPRQYWNPCLVVVDEAHLFSPQTTTSKRAFASSEAIASLCTQGRKRGLCPILLTQRLSSLHKDAAAQCENVMVGKTFLDNDVKRAAEFLQMEKKEQSELQQLKRGQFFAFGQAFRLHDKGELSGIVKVHVGETYTAPPKSGSKQAYVPPKRRNVIAVLPKLEDLPREVEERAQTEQALRHRVAVLEEQLQNATAEVPVQDTTEVEALSEQLVQALATIEEFERVDAVLRIAIEKLRASAEHVLTETVELPTVVAQNAPRPAVRTVQKRVTTSVVRAPTATPSLSKTKLGKGPGRLLAAAALFYPKSISKSRMGLLTSYSHKGGTFNNYISELVSDGLLERVGSGLFKCTPAGRQVAGPVSGLPPLGSRELLDMWRDNVPSGAAKILDALYKYGALSKKDLGERTGYEAGGGTFNNYLSILRTNGLIFKVSDRLYLSEDLRRR